MLALVSVLVFMMRRVKSFYILQSALLVLFLLSFSFETFAQPTVLYTSLSSTTPTAINNRFDVNPVSIFRQCRFQANQSGNFFWAFSLGTTSLWDYSICWRPYTSANVISYNTFIPVTYNNGAKYNTSNGGSDGELNNIQSGYYYTFNVGIEALADNIMEVLETSYNPTPFSSLTSTWGSNGQRIVTVIMNALPQSSENIFLRYTTGGINFPSSSTIQFTMIGNTGTAVIPAQAQGATVHFYAYTSPRPKVDIDADVSAYGQAAHDMATLMISGIPASYLETLPINVANANASSNGDYATLAEAFTAINNFPQAGNNIIVKVNGTTIEPATGAILNQNTSPWTSMVIYPTATGYSITGNLAGLSTIKLNGADNVTINGSIGGIGSSKDLTLSNISSVSGSSTIKLESDATSNTITNCNVLGSSVEAVNAAGGTIWIASNSTLTGNDNNTISFCNIGPVGSNLPSKAIYFTGSLNYPNNTNTITDNNIYDYFSGDNSSSGIYVDNNTSDCIFNNNNFYQNASRTQTTASQHSAIWIANGTGNNHLISGNVIGYTGTLARYTISGISGTKFYPIYLYVGNTATTRVESNTITGIDMTGSSDGNPASNSPFTCIFINAGLVNLGGVAGNSTGNAIGSMSTTADITYSTTSATTTYICGIYNQAASDWVTNNNSIGGITLSGAGAILFAALRGNTGTGIWTCSNNIIGGTVNNSIYNTSIASNSYIDGINNTSYSGTFRNNIIRNLTCTGGSSTTSVAGIFMTSNTLKTVSQNTIYNLLNSNVASGANTVSGIEINGTTSNNTIDRNFIYSLSNASTTTTATLNGIRLINGTTLSYNNIISLNANTSGSAVYGINDNGGTNSIFHNTVTLTGSSTTADYALYSTNTGFRDIRNNIFANTQSGGGVHYAVSISSTGSPTINYNDYLGTVFGSTGGANSLTLSPVFGNPSGTLLTDYIPSVLTLTGSNAIIGTIPNDIDGTVRCIPTMGAQEKVSVPGTATATATPNPICVGGTLTLQGTAEGATSWSWTGPNGFTANTQNASITNITLLGNGDYTFTASNCDGSTSPVIISVVVNSIPSASASNNSPMCAGGTLNLNSSGGDTYSWSGPNGFSSTLQNPAIPSVTASATGTYAIAVTAANGCTANTTTLVTINANPVPAPATSGAACVGGILELTSAEITGGTYSWTGPSFSSTLQNPLPISPVTSGVAGTYSVTVTDGNGCTGTGSVSVSVGVAPIATATATSPTICAGATIQLNGGPGGMTTYSWTGPSFSTTTASGSYTADFNTLASSGSSSALPGVSGSYQWYLSETGTNANGTYTASTGSLTAGDTYSFGTIAGERALGGLRSGSLVPIIGASFTNNTGTTIQTLTIDYTGEQWRLGTLGRVDRLDFQYSTNATSLTTGTWIDYNPLDFTAPVTGPAIGALDGNLAANRTAITSSITGLNIAAGSTFYIRFNDLEASGADDGLGIDDFTITLGSGNTQNPAITNATTAMSGTYYLTVTDANGCTAQAQTNVTVNPTPVTSPASSGSACLGETLNLTSAEVTGGSYSWTGPNGFSSSLQNPSVFPVVAGSAGTYTINITANGCTGSAPIVIAVFSAPTAVTASNTGPYCEGSTIMLNAVPNGKSGYNWSGPGGWTTSSASQTYNENFNSLVSSGTSSTLPVLLGSYRWFLSEIGTGANATYSAGTGSSATGDTYSFGTTAGDRAFGGLQSGAVNPTIGAFYTNTTGLPVSTVSISYTGEQWRLGALGRVDRIDFQFSSDATSLTTGTWTDENSLDFTAPIQAGTVGALDGNVSPNRTLISSSVTGLNIPAGSSIWIRWTDLNPTGADDGLAVDDLSITLIANNNQNPTRPNSTPGMSGTYNLSTTDVNGCIVNASTNVTVNATSVGGTAIATSPICYNSSTSITLTGYTGTIQWQQSPDGSTWANVTGGSGATSAAYTTPNLTTTTYYRAVVTDGACASANSNILTINITPTVGTPTAVTISAGSEPSCQLTNGTTTTTYSTTATNSTGFNWTLSNALAGSINASTGVMTWANGFSGSVNIQVTATGCNGPSAQVTRTVTITPTVGTPVFTLGATSTRCQGAGTVTYTASATNTTAITYSLDGASITGGNSIIAGTGAITYVAGWSGTSVITASAAGCNGPLTATHTVTVTPTVGTPVFTLGATSTRCQGAGTVTYTASAINTTGATYSLDGASITGGNSIIAGTGAVTYVAGWSGTSVITASAAGCNGPVTAVHTVTVNSTPTIPNQTATICSGASPNFTPTDNPPTTIVPFGTTYTWTVPVVTGGIIGGIAELIPQTSVNQTLTNPTTVAQTATYTVTPIGPNCTGATFTLVVTVNPKPEFINSFPPLTLCSGSTLAFNATTNPASTTTTWTSVAVDSIMGHYTSGTGDLNETLTSNAMLPKAVTYTYTVNSGLCSNTGSFTVTVINVKVKASATPPSVCPGFPFDLYSTSNLGTAQPDTLDETFETGVVESTNGPNGWTTSVDPPGNNAQFTIRQSPYPGAPTTPPYVPVTINWNWNTNNKFYISEDIGNGNITSSLISPSLNTTPYNTLTLDFWDYYRDKGVAQGDTAFIEVSTNNGPYTTVRSFNETHGYPFDFAHETVNLSAYIGITNLRIRFRYHGTWDFYWAIDNVKVTGTKVDPRFIGWTSNPSGYTNTLNVSPTGITQTYPAPITYTATYKDQTSGCSGSASVEVKNYPAPATPTISAFPSGGVFCTPATITFTSSPASWYLWNLFGSPRPSETAQTYTPTLSTDTNILYTNVSVTIKNTYGCYATSAASTITVNPKPVIPAQNATICSGTAFTVTPVKSFPETIVPAGTTYTWGAPVYSPAGSITGGNSQYTGLASISQTLTNITANPATATYTVVPTSGAAVACAGAAFTVTVTINPTPTITGLLNVCVNSDIQLTGSGTAATINPWISGNTGVAKIGNSGLVTGISDGTSIITYTDNIGCKNTIMITVHALPTITTAATATSLCFSTSTQTSQLIYSAVTGSPTTYSITWSPAGLTPITNVALPASRITISIPASAAANTYTGTITVSNSNGCVSTAKTFTLTINPLPTINTFATATSVCFSTLAQTSSLTYSAFTNSPTRYSITWSPAGLPAVTNAILPLSPITISIPASAAAITYTGTIIVSNANGCVSNGRTFTLTVNPTPSITNITASTCSASAFTLSPADVTNGVVPSGTTYSWSAPSGSGFSGGTAGTNASNISGTLTNTTNVPVTATYTVTPKAGSCTGSNFTITVTVNPKPFITPQTRTICGNTAFTVTPTNGSGNIVPTGTIYTWSTPVSSPANAVTGGSQESTGQTSISQTLSNNTSNPATLTYTVTPVSGNCTGASFTVTVTVNSAPNITGPIAVYAGATGVIYTTETGKSNYNWTVSSGGLITSGIGTNQIAVTWNTTGTQTVSVSYTIGSGCGPTIMNVIVYPPATVDFEIVKSQVYPSPSEPGDLVTYTISYLNTGNITATNVIITDLLPPNSLFTYKSSNNSGIYDPDVPSVVWTIPSVPANGSGFVTVTGNWGMLGTAYSYNPTSYYTSSGSSTSTITNNANIRSNQSPLATNAESVTATVPQFCGSIFPDGNNNFKQGENKIIYYPMTILNTGNIYDNFTLTVPATVIANAAPWNELKVSIVDITPTHNVISQSGWIPPGGSFTFMLMLDGTVGTKKPQGGDIFDIVVTSTSTVCNTTSTATLTTTTYNGNITGPDIMVTKTASTGSYSVGSGPITYTIILSNVGTSTANNITLKDYLPSNAPVPNPGDINNGGTTSGYTVTWPAVNVKIEDVFLYTVTIYPNCLSAPSLINKAEVVYAADIDNSNNISIITTPVILTRVPPVPTTSTPVICTGNTALLSATGAIGSETYRWYSTATGGSIIGTGSSYTTSPLTSDATYYVSLYDPSSFCESNRSSITIVVNSNVETPVFTSGAISVCQDAANETYSATAANNTGIAYTVLPASAGIIDVNTGVMDWNSAFSGTAVITATADGCTGPLFASRNVTVNPKPSVIAQTATICSGAIFTVTPAGVPVGTTYTWGAPVLSPLASITGGSAQATGQISISQTLTNTTTAVATATYTVTPTSGTCNGNTFTVTVTVNPTPTITGTLNVCVNSTTSLIGSGTPASSNPWTSGTPAVATVSNAGIVTGKSAGNSIITYTDSNGCIKTTTVTVHALPPTSLIYHQ